MYGSECGSNLRHLCWDAFEKYMFTLNYNKAIPLHNTDKLLYPRFNEVEGGGIYWFHPLSILLSICLWTESCPLYIFHNINPIHFIFIHISNQVQKVCCVLSLFFYKNSQILNYAEYF